MRVARVRAPAHEQVLAVVVALFVSAVEQARGALVRELHGVFGGGRRHRVAPAKGVRTVNAPGCRRRRKTGIIDRVRVREQELNCIKYGDRN